MLNYNQSILIVTLQSVIVRIMHTVNNRLGFLSNKIVPDKSILNILFICQISTVRDREL